MNGSSILIIFAHRSSVFETLDTCIETSNKRPLLATECDNLAQAEKFRRELIRDVTKNISAIANGEFYAALVLNYHH